MDFFSKCTTEAEVKETFRRLSKCFHPDKGGEEALMTDLINQYDNWQPSYKAQTKYYFNVNRRPTIPDMLEKMYEEKIDELNILLYNARNELADLRTSHQFNIDVLRAERVQKSYIQDEAKKLQKQIDALNQQLEEKKQELIQERDKHRNRSLADKIKTVFGYE
jgi:hypothetical protein